MVDATYNHGIILDFMDYITQHNYSFDLQYNTHTCCQKVSKPTCMYVP